MPDLTVVGAGPIGLAIAWRAARQGWRVTLYDAGPDDAGAWYAAAGILAPVSEETMDQPELTGLLIAAAAAWPEFAAELTSATGLDIGYRDEGTLTVALTADDQADVRRLLAVQADLGLPARPQSTAELREREPLLANGIRGGAHLLGDRQVDPRRVMIALRAACRDVGVGVVRARIVDLAELPAGRVVVAAGCGTAELTGLPVRPVKGQSLRLRPPGRRTPGFDHVIRGYADGRRVYLVPRHDGEVVVGATVEERDDHLATAGAVLELLRSALDLMPELSRYQLAETCVRHRPATPDQAPFLGPLHDRPEVLVAAGHHQNGILLTPLTADLLVRALTETIPPEPLVAFGPARAGTTVRA